MIVNYAKFLNKDDIIDEEVNIEVNEISILCFAQSLFYELKKNEVYPVQLYFSMFSDDVEIELLEKPKFCLENLNQSYSYNLYGKLEKDIFDLGKFKIQDEQLLLPFISKFSNHFVRLRVDRIGVKFL